VPGFKIRKPVEPTLDDQNICKSYFMDSSSMLTFQATSQVPTKAGFGLQKRTGPFERNQFAGLACNSTVGGICRGTGVY